MEIVIITDSFEIRIFLACFLKNIDVIVKAAQFEIIISEFQFEYLC